LKLLTIYNILFAAVAEVLFLGTTRVLRKSFVFDVVYLDLVLGQLVLPSVMLQNSYVPETIVRHSVSNSTITAES
jgi:hypothetical protein